MAEGEYMPQMEKPDKEEAHGMEEWDIDYSDIQGQEAVKRATMVAVAEDITCFMSVRRFRKDDACQKDSDDPATA